jgi:Raf kinase inhibitor-like YbhB/YbcL family protein
MSLDINSTVFESGGTIPEKYSCDGENISPPIEWRGVPSEAESLVLVCDDPDAGSVDPFTHWVLYNIPANAVRLPESFNDQMESLHWDGTQGRNSFGNTRYDGPCPPTGENHRYFFRMYALDEDLDLPPGMNRDQILHRIEDHVIEHAEMEGRFSRS